MALSFTNAAAYRIFPKNLEPNNKSLNIEKNQVKKNVVIICKSSINVILNFDSKK